MIYTFSRNLIGDYRSYIGLCTKVTTGLVKDCLAVAAGCGVQRLDFALMEPVARGLASHIALAEAAIPKSRARLTKRAHQK